MKDVNGQDYHERKMAAAREFLQFARYDAPTGLFTWVKANSGGRRGPGDIAGTKNSGGYWSIGFRRFNFLAHRLAWLATHGEWPSGEIDHINGLKQDNRIENLRMVDRVTNAENQRRAMSSNKSCGRLGVTIDDTVWRSRPFKASIKLKGKSINLGNYSTAQEAHEAYISAKRRLHNGCTI